MNYLLFFQEAPKATGPLGFTAEFVFPVFLLVIGVALLAIVMSAYNMLQNPKGIKNFAISLLALLVLLAIGFALSSGDIPDGLKEMASAGVYRWVGASIFVAGALMVVGFVFLFVDLIRGMFKL